MQSNCSTSVFCFVFLKPGVINLVRFFMRTTKAYELFSPNFEVVVSNSFLRTTKAYELFSPNFEVVVSNSFLA